VRASLQILAGRAGRGVSVVPARGISVLSATVQAPIGDAETIVNALGPFRDKGVEGLVRGAAQTGFFSYNDHCGAIGGGSSNLQLAQFGINSGVQIGLTAAKAIPIVGDIISSVASLATLPFAHHAQAVKNEQATLCAAVPAANQMLRGIDQLVSSGQIDTATASAAMDQGYSNWRDSIKGILKDTGGKCNAACVYEKVFQAAIMKRKQDYAVMDAQQSRGAQPVNGGGVVNAPGGVVVSPSTNGGVFSGVVNALNGAVNAITGQPVAAGPVAAQVQANGAATAVLAVGAVLVALVLVRSILGR
jgi:hypothetical protein